MFRYCHYSCYYYDNYCCSKQPTWQPALTTPPYTTSVRMTLAGRLTPCFNSNSLSSSTVTPASKFCHQIPSVNLQYTCFFHIKGLATLEASLSLFIQANDEFQCFPYRENKTISKHLWHFKTLNMVLSSHKAAFTLSEKKLKTQVMRFKAKAPFGIKHCSLSLLFTRKAHTILRFYFGWTRLKEYISH